LFQGPVNLRPSAERGRRKAIFPCVPGALHEFRKLRYGKRLRQSGHKLLISFPVSTYVLCAIAVGHHTIFRTR